MSVVKLDISTNSFTGLSGKTYIVYPSISTGRYPVLEQMQIEIEYGTTVSGFRSEMERAYKALNEVKFADAATIVNNAINGVSRVEAGQPHPLLMICALFICTAEENQGKWSEAEAAAKVADWANIEVDFFLNCAKALFLRFMPDLNTDLRNISAEAVNGQEGQK